MSKSSKKSLPAFVSWILFFANMACQLIMLCCQASLFYNVLLNIPILKYINRPILYFFTDIIPILSIGLSPTMSYVALGLIFVSFIIHGIYKFNKHDQNNQYFTQNNLSKYSVFGVALLATLIITIPYILNIISPDLINGYLLLGIVLSSFALMALNTCLKVENEPNFTEKIGIHIVNAPLFVLDKLCCCFKDKDQAPQLKTA